MTQRAIDHGGFGGTARPTAAGQAGDQPRTAAQSPTQVERAATPSRSTTREGGTDAGPSWKSAYLSAVAQQVWYGAQWVLNGVTTVAGIVLLIAPPIVSRIPTSSDGPLFWPGWVWIVTAVIGIVVHGVITSIERDVWHFRASGPWYMRAWQHTKHVLLRPLTSLASLVVTFSIDIGTAFYGTFHILAGQTLPVGTGWTLPAGGPWFMMAVGLVAVWIATTSEPGWRAASERRRLIGKYKDRYFALVDARVARQSDAS